MSELQADYATRADVILQEIETHKKSVEKLVGVIGNLGVTSGLPKGRQLREDFDDCVAGRRGHRDGGGDCNRAGGLLASGPGHPAGRGIQLEPLRKSTGAAHLRRSIGCLCCCPG